MPVDWINDDGTFTPGFEQHLDEDVREYAKDAKNLNALLKRGLESKRSLHDRVKLPTDPSEREKFLNEHFTDVLEARTKAKAAADEAAQAKSKEDKTKADAEALQKAQQRVTDLLGPDPQRQMELVRRAFRGRFCPQWIKDGIAQVVGVEFEKITDEQFTAVVKNDPAVVQTLMIIGDMAQDGRVISGDGKTGSEKVEEQYPSYPYDPEVYAKSNPGDEEYPMKLWFINRGAEYEGDHYLGGYGIAKPA
ncbi:MAG: hypothetical protein WC907_00955 [Acholeplasmataceae bacterium]|jgi:hypothetical protein